MEPFNQTLVTNPRTYDTSTGDVLLEAANNLSDVDSASSARTNLDVYSTAEVDEYLAPKATAGGVRFSAGGQIVISDNATTETAFHQDGNVLTYSWVGNASQQTFRQYVYVKSEGSITSTGGGVEILHLENSTKLNVLFRQFGVNTGHYNIGWNNIIDGTFKHFVVKVDYTGASPIVTLAVNGVDAGAGTVELSATGSFDDSNAYYVRIGAQDSTKYYGGALRDFCIFNRALTATEVADLYRNGLAGIADADRWGSENAADSGPDFANATDTGTASTTKFDFTLTGVYGNQSMRFPAYISPGTKVEVKLSGVSSSGGTYTTRINNYAGTASNATSVTISGDGVYTITANNADANGFRLMVGAGNFSVGTFTATIDYIRVLGAIAAYPMDEGIGYQIHDISSNHYDGLLSTSGFTHLLPKTEGYIRDFGVDAYDGGSGTGVLLVASGRDILPDKSHATLATVYNAGTATVGDLTVNQSNTSGSGQVAIGSYSASGLYDLTAKSSIDFDLKTREQVRTAGVATYPNLAITSTDSDATNIDIRVDYKKIIS